MEYKLCAFEKQASIIDSFPSGTLYHICDVLESKFQWKKDKNRTAVVGEKFIYKSIQISICMVLPRNSYLTDWCIC